MGAIAADLETACGDPRAAQQATFVRILEQARASTFGREHGLAAVRTLEDFRAAVPLRSSADFQPYVHRAMAGEPDVLFRGVPIFIGKTSGTTGESKYIAYPAASRYAVWNQLAPWLDQFSDAELADGCFVAGRYAEEVSPGGVTVGSATGFLRHVMHDVPWFSAIPTELSEQADYEARYLGILRELLARPLRVLVTPNPSTLLALVQQFCKHRGALSDGRGAVATRLRALPDAITLGDLWPSLTKLATWQDGSTALYRERLQAAAPNAMLIRAPSGATEGMVMTRGWGTDDGCVPSLLCSVFEYLDGNETLGVSDLEVGQTVRLVLTSERGTYRCLTDDLYQVVGRHRRAPRLRYVGRSSLTSSLTGEKLTEPQVISALASISADLGGAEVQVAPVWGDPPYYALIVELTRELDPAARAILVARFEAELRLQNSEYACKRDSLRLAPPVLVVLERGEVARRRLERSNATGRSDVQLKAPTLTTELFVPANYRVAGAQ